MRHSRHSLSPLRLGIPSRDDNNSKNTESVQMLQGWVIGWHVTVAAPLPHVPNHGPVSLAHLPMYSPGAGSSGLSWNLQQVTLPCPVEWSFVEQLRQLLSPTSSGLRDAAFNHGMGISPWLGTGRGHAWHPLTPPPGPWGMNGEGEAHVAMRDRAPQQQHVPGPH